MKKTAESVYETDEYGIFKLDIVNRTVRQTEELKKSMALVGWMNSMPMTVVKDSEGYLRIKDGQHRFEIAKLLKIPVKYVIITTAVPSVYTMEKTKIIWTLADYLVAYTRKGLSNYLVVDEYHKTTGIGLSNTIALVANNTAGTSNHHYKFKEGIYSTGDLTHAKQVAEIVYITKQERLDFAIHTYYVQAISRAIQVDILDYRQLIENIKKYAYKMKKQPTAQDYLDLLETIYNTGKGIGKKIPLAFLALAAAEKRQKNFGRSL